MDARSIRGEFRSPKQIDNVVQIPWAAAFRHRAKLLCKQLLRRVATHLVRGWESVGIRMRDLPQYRRFDRNFCGR